MWALSSWWPKEGYSAINPLLGPFQGLLHIQAFSGMHSLFTTSIGLDIGWMLLVVIKLPYLKSSMLCSKLSKGIGHNNYGEPAWPNDILYIFPIVISGISSSILGLAIHEALGIIENATPFATPLEILPEWYLLPTFNLLRILSDKCIGILSMFYFPGVLISLPFGESLGQYQNPFRRPIMLSIFMCGSFYSIWLSIGPLLAIFQALPFIWGP